MLKAVSDGDLNAIQEIIKNKGSESIRTIDKHGKTAFHIAADKGHLKIIQWLFDNDANYQLRERDHEGRTGIHLACKNGHVQVAQWLYSIGSDKFKINFEIFKIACENNQINMVDWLYELSIENEDPIDIPESLSISLIILGIKLGAP